MWEAVRVRCTFPARNARQHARAPRVLSPPTVACLASIRIMNGRAGQNNFQLIIITHDEEFVQLLGRSNYTDCYWRVCKDSNQHSI
mmetsp:Transcript_38329/g.96427  ORF Transcript_38329/g.96427 Transcript_38329/m.96427 type:complete len:86 (+) Transcript_38329:218-475(+)